MSELTNYQSVVEFFSTGDGYQWWAELHRSNQDGGVSRRGDRAELKRCRTIPELLLVPGYHRLRIAVRQNNLAISDHRIALVAGILSEVRTDSPKDKRSFGKRMANGVEGSDRAQVSGLRFRRLIQLDDDEDLYARLRRIIRLCDRTAGVGKLSADLAYWGPKTKQVWAADYYTNAPQED